MTSPPVYVSGTIAMPTGSSSVVSVNTVTQVSAVDSPKPMRRMTPALSSETKMSPSSGSITMPAGWSTEATSATLLAESIE